MDAKRIKEEIVSKFEKRTGFHNLLGSVDKIVEELLPEIEECFRNANDREKTK